MTPYQWIKAVTGWDYHTIYDDVVNFSGTDFLESIEIDKRQTPIVAPPTLPTDCINLTDPIQLEYYRDSAVVCEAVRYIHQRRLLTAVNSSKAFYVSLTDHIHRNRLIIPYFDAHGNLVHYQSRQLYDNDGLPKYLSKFDSVKYPFNLPKLDASLGYYMAFEGAVDAMFVRNSIALTGVNLTEEQAEFLGPFDLFMKRIWVLDNPFIDETARTKAMKLADKGEYVFSWPTQMRRFKDVSELAQAKQLDEVPYALFERFAKTGIDLKTSI